MDAPQQQGNQNNDYRTMISKADRQFQKNQRLCGNNIRVMAKLEDLKKRGLMKHH